MSPVSPKRLTVFYGHIASNIGDLAINTGTVDLARAAFPEAQIEFVLLNAGKSKFLEMGLASFGEGVTLHYFDSHSSRMKPYLDDPATFFADCGIERPEVVLLAAGEHLFDYGNGENYKSLFWRTLPAFAAASLGIACVQLPATYGPFSGSISADIAHAMPRVADSAAARDARSCALMAQITADCPLPLHLDPAFHIAWPDALRERPRRHGVVGFAMRSDGWGIRLGGEARAQLTEQFRADGFSSSSSYQISKRLLDHVLNDSSDRVRIFVQTTADQELAEHLVQSSGASDRIELCRLESVYGYIEALGQLDRVYTSRFHAVILALLAGTPAYAVYFEAHGHKMPGLFEMLDWPRACANGTALAPENIQRLFASERETEEEMLKGVLRRTRALRSAGTQWLREALASTDATLPKPREALTRFQQALDEAATQLLLNVRAPAMPRAALLKLRGLCEEARVVLVYGGGAVALMASDMPGKLVLGVSEDREWVRAMRSRTVGSPSPVLLHVAANDEKAPSQPGDTPRLPSTQQASDIWEQSFFRDPDLIMIDGPDPVACFAQSLLRLRKPAKILFAAYEDCDARDQIEQILKPSRMLGPIAQFDVEPGMLAPGERGALVRLSHSGHG